MTVLSTLKTIALLAIGACTADPVANQQLLVYENFVGEGRPEYETISNQIELRDTPNSGAAITNVVPVSQGQFITYNNAITRTLRSGPIELQGDVLIQVREFGDISTISTDLYYSDSITWIEKKITAKDKPELLMWISEGNCFIKSNQIVYESDSCPLESGSEWTLQKQPTTESWIELNLGNSKGWAKVDSQQIRESSRSF